MLGQTPAPSTRTIRTPVVPTGTKRKIPQGVLIALGVGLPLVFWLYSVYMAEA